MDMHSIQSFAIHTYSMNIFTCLMVVFAWNYTGNISHVHD